MHILKKEEITVSCLELYFRIVINSLGIFSENETSFCFGLFIHRTPFNVEYDINVMLYHRLDLNLYALRLKD